MFKHTGVDADCLHTHCWGGLPEVLKGEEEGRISVATTANLENSLKPASIVL